MNIPRFAASVIFVGAMGCGESVRDVPACRAAWHEIRIPAELGEHKTSAAVWLDGRLFVLRLEPEPGEPYGPVGIIYEPPGSFRTMSEENSPSLVFLESAFAVGRELVTLAGIGYYVDDDPSLVVYGGRYDPETDTWRSLPPMANGSGPVGEAMGDEVFLVLEDLDISLPVELRYLAFDPAVDAYRTLSRGPLPSLRYQYVWSGEEIITWGGYDPVTSTPSSVGARYSPASDSWTSVTADGAPTTGGGHLLAWTGSEMLVWGANGTSGDPSGARYTPSSDQWEPMSSEGSPPSWLHSLTADGKLVLWGGQQSEPPYDVLGGGGVYDPTTDGWSRIPETCGPGALAAGTLTWIDDGVVFWGGSRLSACEDSEDPSACFRSLRERAWYLPRAALFGEVPRDEGECTCPEPIGAESP